LKLFPAHVAVVVEQILLSATVDAAIALGAAELDAGLHQPRAYVPAAELVADRKTLKLGKARKIPDAQAPDRFLADIGEQMARGEIVAVELFLVRTVLLCDESRAAHSDHPHEILDRANDRDGDILVLLEIDEIIIDRTCLLDGHAARIHVEIRRELAPEFRAPAKAKAFRHAQA